MTKTLRIEVTEAFVLAACAAYDNSRGDMDAEPAHYPAMFHVLNAAFQHPEFVRQIREQVIGCVPADVMPMGDGGRKYNAACQSARANLAGLLGVGDG
jgi:hypothetical protein